MAGKRDEKIKSSRIPGFYKFSFKKRLKILEGFAGLNKEEIKILSNRGALGEIGERMLENVVGAMPLPLGIATNFLINGKDYLIPMAIEEPSVVAAASNAAKMAREKGGFKTSSTTPIMIGQIQVVNLSNLAKAELNILKNKKKILEIANKKDPLLLKLGGGAKDIEVREIKTEGGKMLILHFLVDVKDAMGANVVNTMAEAVSPLIERITGGKTLLRIVSNLATHRLASAKAVFEKEVIGGENVVDGIIKAYLFAKSDLYRCATHNKGIMNGIDAVLLATANDFRAVEAGAHAFAVMTGKYLPLTDWQKNKDGDLAGHIKLPLAVGIVGGAANVHPTAKINLKILGVKTAGELAQVVAAVGLAQNFAALRALVKEGIQRGHMSLHARNVAIAAGAKGKMIDEIAKILVKEKKVRVDRARELLKNQST